MRALFVPLAFLILAAAPATDPLLDRIVSGARAVPPAAMAFERTSRSVVTAEQGAPETHVRTERWDGRTLAPVSIDGKPPTAEQLAETQKSATERPLAGYYRLADYLKGGAVRVADPQGRVLYRITGLPKGSVTVGKDISASLVGEALVDTSGAVPYVSRLRVYLPKPLSFFMVAKLDTFEFVNEYRTGAGGKPALVKSTQSVAGAQFGKSGTTRTEIEYRVLR